MKAVATIAAAVTLGLCIAYDAEAKPRALCVKGYEPKCRPLRISKPVQRVLLEVARCEQPGNGWRGVRWDHPGPWYPGGMGVLPEHYERWRPKGSARLQRHAHPADQLQASWRAYKYYRRVYGLKGGTTFWVCSALLGPPWLGVTYEGEVLRG